MRHGGERKRSRLGIPRIDRAAIGVHDGQRAPRGEDVLHRGIPYHFEDSRRIEGPGNHGHVVRADDRERARALLRRRRVVIDVLRPGLRARSDDHQTRERERRGWERYMSIPELKSEIEAAGITSLAQFYTSKIKYDPDYFVPKSAEIQGLLERQGFWGPKA